MAEAATPSAVTMSTLDAGADPSKASNDKSTAKPTRPDETAFREAEAKLRSQLEAAQKKTKEIDTRLNAAKPNNKDSPNAQRQSQLKSELNEIRSKQSNNKNSRTGVQERITALDQKLKTQVQEQKNARAKLPFKSVSDADVRIKQLEDEVNTGKLRIVDEKKNLDEASQLRAKKKQFVGVENIQQNINTIKQQISDTKKELDNPESKALSAEYDVKQAELNTLKSEQDGEFKNLNTHREAWRKAKDDQTRAFTELKALRDEHYANKRAFDFWEREAKRQQYARKDAERKERDFQYKERDILRELEEANYPAYGKEISSCDVLIKMIDPNKTYTPGESDRIQETEVTKSGLRAASQRKVDDSGLTGTKLSKKTEDEDSYFIGGGGKKGKKGKKSKAQEVTYKSDWGDEMGSYFTPAVAQQFEITKVKGPSAERSREDVLRDIYTHRAFYVRQTDAQTQRNVQEVEEKLAKLRLRSAEESPSSVPNKATSHQENESGNEVQKASANAQPLSSTAEASIQESDPAAEEPSTNGNADGVNGSATQEVSESTTAETPAADGEKNEV